jgi:hypothetical protein
MCRPPGWRSGENPSVFGKKMRGKKIWNMEENGTEQKKRTAHGMCLLLSRLAKELIYGNVSKVEFSARDAVAKELLVECIGCVAGSSCDRAKVGVNSGTVNASLADVN